MHEFVMTVNINYL